MTPKQAEKVLEDLRKGIPPSGFLEYFTVGRKDQIEWLNSHLNGDDGYALLLKANYGSGKSHLLQLIREKALRAGFATSLVVLDANSGVRFNRMDQIFGAIIRNLKFTHEGGVANNLAQALDFLADHAERAKSNPKAPGHQYWAKVTNNWTWDYSEKLTSPALFVAFRAWAATDSESVRETIIDWLSFPEIYQSSRKFLYERLVEGLRKHFRDPRPDWQLYQEGALSFHGAGYQSCWAALEDVHQMGTAAGLPGMVVLFDEFEDVLTNLKSIAWKESAFWNLFRFVSGDRFTGKTFYAVTPSFAQKCKEVLMEKGRWDINYKQFDELETFEMSPLSKLDLLELARRIGSVHQVAYSYKVDHQTLPKLSAAIEESAKSPVQDRARQAIKLAVSVLDEGLE
jgi:hypothetical protein